MHLVEGDRMDSEGRDAGVREGPDFFVFSHRVGCHDQAAGGEAERSG